MAHNEQIFTPYWVVDLILDKIGYIGSNIRKKHIIDNSCGEGAFLVRITERYINKCLEDGLTFEEIDKEVETYIHGIEIDNETLLKCAYNLKWGEYGEKVYGKPTPVQILIRPHLVWRDALTTTEFDGKMDFVVGNPPYCKIHDMKQVKRDIVKTFKFTQDSNTDLYLAFFEKGIEMLNENGVLAYITPNSWMTSKAGKDFRNYLFDSNKLAYIIQFGSEKIFDNATTFTNITIIDNNKKNGKLYWQYGKDGKINETNLDSSFINGNLYVGTDSQLKELRKILEKPLNDCQFDVKNGFATLKDKLFINTNDTNIQNATKNYRPMIKASLGKTYMGVFPYDDNGNPLKFEELDDFSQKYLLEKAKELEIDTSKEDWYLYGRSQGLKDYTKEKITINNVIKDISSIKLFKIYKNLKYGVYGGFYILGNNGTVLDRWVSDLICDCLNQEDFIENYLKVLGKYKNGGYYTFSTDDLKRYLNYYIN